MGKAEKRPRCGRLKTVNEAVREFVDGCTCDEFDELNAPEPDDYDGTP